ncbi:MAG: hypothetical protein ACKOXB_04365 [Flavobacteriales bacterium]
MKMIIKTPLLIAIGAIMMAASCSKKLAYEDLPKLDAADQEVLDTIQESDALYTHVYTVVHTEVSNVEDQAFKTGGTAVGISADPNAVITYEIDSTDKANKFIKKVTISYPSANSWNGYSKQGKIIITKTGRINKVGTMCYISFENFKIAGMALTGTPTLENKGFVNGTYTMALKMTDGDLGNGIVKMDFDMSLIFSISNGAYTLSMSGTQNITFKNSTYATFYKVPCVRLLDCDYITKGAKEINIKGEKMIVDYGDGTCDNKSTVVFKTKTYQCELL